MLKLSIYKSFVFSIFLTVIFSSPLLSAAQIKVAFEPSSGYSQQEIETNLVLSVPPGERITGFEAEISTNSIVEIAGYKELNPGCSLEVFKKDGITKVICLAKPGEFLAGDREIIQLKLNRTTTGEADLFVQNVDIGNGTEVITQPATFVFETKEEPVSAPEESAVEREGVLFFTIASSWLERNYRALLFTIIGLGTVVSLGIVVSRRKRLPSQLKLFTMLIVGLAAGTIFYANIDLSDENLDPTSNAGEEEFKPIENLDSNGADLNGDGMIDSIDFEIFKSDFREWAENYKYFTRSDFNDDRKINMDDYLIFIELYNDGNGTTDSEQLPEGQSSTDPEE